MASERILKVKTVRSSYDSNYAHSGLMFAYCSKITNNEVKQITNFCSCREDLANYLFCDFCGSNSKISMDRSRYIVRRAVDSSNVTALAKAEKWFNSTTKTGLKIVNVMEDRHGWPLTRMIDAGLNTKKIPGDYYNPSKELTTFYKVLIGSNKWMKSPHMISLYILLFRSGSDKRLSSIKNYDGLSKVCNSFTSKSSGDRWYIFRTFKFWDMVMANSDKMFTGVPIRDNFKSSKYDGDHYDEGILKLCRFRCANRNISSKFVALAEKAGLRE